MTTRGQGSAAFPPSLPTDRIPPFDVLPMAEEWQRGEHGIIQRFTALNCGTDIVREERGTFLVLEDNARTPSGVSCAVARDVFLQRYDRWAAYAGG